MKKLFGTDGVRGVINKNPMTPSKIVKLGKSIAQYFKKQNNKDNRQIIIGKDTRISGYIIENALTAGICSIGVDVLLVRDHRGIQRHVMNLKPIHHQVLGLLGAEIRNCYILDG